jgi:hypothetical protein
MDFDVIDKFLFALWVEKEGDNKNVSLVSDCDAGWIENKLFGLICILLAVRSKYLIIIKIFINLLARGPVLLRFADHSDD